MADEEYKANEEMFGAQEPEDPDLPATQDEPNENPEGKEPEGAEPEPEQPEPTTDYAALMRELGLTQFKDPAEAIRAVREQNKYIGQLEAERAQWRKAQTPKAEPEKSPEIDPDEFIANPDNVLQQRGFVRREDVAAMVEAARMRDIQEQRIVKFQSEHEDFDSLKPDMAAIYQANQWLDNIPASEAMAILYERAKRTRTAAKPPSQVQPADKDKAGRASTAGGKGAQKAVTKTTGLITAEEALKMTPEEIEARLGYEAS